MFVFPFNTLMWVVQETINGRNTYTQTFDNALTFSVKNTNQRENFVDCRKFFVHFSLNLIGFELSLKERKISLTKNTWKRKLLVWNLSDQSIIGWLPIEKLFSETFCTIMKKNNSANSNAQCFQLCFKKYHVLIGYHFPAINSQKIFSFTKAINQFCNWCST